MIRVPDIAGQTIAVMGLGVSGLATARALRESGATVLAWDDSEAGRAAAEKAGIEPSDLSACDWTAVASLVLSPGIPHTFPEPHPIAQAARDHGVEIICDIELLARARPRATYVGITGTNGKSTTTALVGHILQAAGRRIQVGGNFGPPALGLDPLGAGDVYVLEMSSFQLERTYSAIFDIAALINVSADHLDRHGGFEGYVAAKRRLFRGQTEASVAIIGVDDEVSTGLYEEYAEEGVQHVVPISGAEPIRSGVYAVNGVLYDNANDTDAVIADLRDIASLPGAHNWQNAAAAYAVAAALEVPTPAIVAALASFPGLPHRQEMAGAIDGVAYVNDSKATNADAAAKALGCYDRIYWIAGGKAKSDGIEPLRPYFARIAHAFLIGESGPAFSNSLGNDVAHSIIGDLASAVAEAHAMAATDHAQPRPTVLLSPSAASYDQFPNFAARGDAFKEIVAQLASNGTRGSKSTMAGGAA